LPWFLPIFHPDVAWPEEKLLRRVSAAPLTAVGVDKIGPSGLSNRTIWFFLFRAGAFNSCPIRVATHFGDSAGESTTSSASNKKGGDSGRNGSDLDKGNILKPTFDTLTEEGRKVFEAYRANLEDLFLLCCGVTRQGTILKDTTPIVFAKPEVWPNPSPSLNDFQNMISTALERQTKSIEE
jgi:hypothetical protein